jgi:phage gpG-like protein
MGVSYPGGQSPDKAARAWGAMMRRTTDLGPAMKVGAEAVQRLIQNTFQTSKSPVGAKWDALDEKTIAKRRKKSSTPLVDTGKLRLSMYARGGARSIAFGTNTGYAGFQQFGTRYIPARPFLPITSSGELTTSSPPAKTVFDRISAQVGNYIVNGKLVR